MFVKLYVLVLMAVSLTFGATSSTQQPTPQHEPVIIILD
jgi:hypothetical protein